MGMLDSLESTLESLPIIGDPMKALQASTTAAHDQAFSGDVLGALGTEYGAQAHMVEDSAGNAAAAAVDLIPLWLKIAIPVAVGGIVWIAIKAMKPL